MAGLVLFCCQPASAQKQSTAKGKLFIIGGGGRSPALMRSLVTTSAFRANDYAVVLPMSSESPDTAFYYFKADLEPVCKNAIVNFNFTKDRVNDKNWLDSLEHARLIFITGGDQDRFMKVVLNSPVIAAIHKAYRSGATIGGTSAGAAVMSKYMITGNQLTDTTYYSTFRKIVDNNIEFKEGLGLLVPVIIDQHFVARSRYNRLLSALAKYPSYLCIGIDEATAIIVQGNRIRVTGGSQVIVLRNPEQLKITAGGLIKMKDLKFSIYTAGDEFKMENE
jgi:cyanophycinase